MSDSPAGILSATFLSPAALTQRGVSRNLVRHLLTTGALVRLRNGRFVPAGTHPTLVSAGRLGARLDCVSLLAELGVFVASVSGLHVQFEPATTRLPPRPRDVRAHWRSTARPREALAADVIEALAQACRCQTPREAVATLDSAWHQGFVDEEGIGLVFARLPRRHQSLRQLLDPRSESGVETLLRLILRALGAHIELQVPIPGVGRVDFVVDGWLIIECDSKAHHDGWEAQKRDRRRDLAAATLGYTTVRPLAEDILYHRDEVFRALAQTLTHRSRSGVETRTPRNRAATPATRR